MCLLINVACSIIAQVGRDTYSWFRMWVDDGDKAAAGEERTSSYTRHNTWRQGSYIAAWRLGTCRRTGSCVWLVDADNMMAASFALGCLHGCKLADPPPALPEDWLVAHSLCISRERLNFCNPLAAETDGHAVWCVFDLSHAITHDIIHAYKKSGLAPLFLVLSAVCCVPHGPWSSQAIWRQSIDVIVDKRERRCPDNSPLWQRRAAETLWDRDASFMIGNDDVQAWLWQVSYDSGPWANTGPAHNHIRFCGFAHRAKQAATAWTVRLWGYECIALDEDWLKGASAKAFILGKRADPQAGQVAKMKHESELDQQLRGACCNSVVFSIRVLSNTGYNVLLRGIVLVGAAWLSWRPTQSNTFHSVLGKSCMLACSAAGQPGTRSLQLACLSVPSQ